LTDNDIRHPYALGMDRNLYDSLEAIANLLYLIKVSLHDPAAASTYVEFAEERIKAISLRLSDGMRRPDFGDNLPFS
jgi:hypothetical protein